MGRKVYPIDEGVRWPTSPEHPGRVRYFTGDGEGHMSRFYLEEGQPAAIKEGEATLCALPKGGRRVPAVLTSYGGDNFLIVFK